MHDLWKISPAKKSSVFFVMPRGWLNSVSLIMIVGIFCIEIQRLTAYIQFFRKQTTNRDKITKFTFHISESYIVEVYQQRNEKFTPIPGKISSRIKQQLVKLVANTLSEIHSVSSITSINISRAIRFALDVSHPASAFWIPRINSRR